MTGNLFELADFAFLAFAATHAPCFLTAGRERTSVHS